MLHIFLLFLSAFAFANDSIVPTREQQQSLIEHNRKLSGLPNPDGLPIVRPYAEFEQARYFLINESFSFDSQAAKLGMLKNLPANMVALVLTDSSSKVRPLEQLIAKVLPVSRFRVVVIPGGSGFWVRDSLPLAVYTGDTTSSKMALTGAQYFHGNHPGPAMSGLLHVPFQEHGYYYEGGNFIADLKGNCLAIDNRITEIADSVFQRMYGCSRMVRLPFRAGIGHVDERVKIVSDEIAVTDEPDYVATLESLGYKTTLMPRPSTRYGTYVNALQANGSIFVPTYNESSDSRALSIYKSFGLTVTGYNSTTLSSQGLGSLHCITMTYPAGTLDAYWNSLPVSRID